ncbi:MAG: YidC/Oxa1 family rane protein insertase [Actinomycetota bacterium]|nr:YidC/Oxa1 family rane protein insertase [Actinomycetota bacterium]
MSVINAILHPLELGVAWIMVAFHAVLTRLGLPETSGWTWSLSIVGLVIVIRILLIPLFVKQIKASRGLQMIQPEMKKIQDKYKGRSDQASREAMMRETTELYRRTGTNPLASCLPILLQSPIFFALFRVLNGIPRHNTIGPLDKELVTQVDDATLFGAPLSDTFMNADTTSTQILTIALVALMSLTTFTTQHQLMRKNMPASALDNPFARQQKIMLYVLPLIFAFSGINFPIGVLVYWLTTNLWTMGQQFFVIRRMPAPGSPAEKALRERRVRRGKDLPENQLPLSTVEGGDNAEQQPSSGQRQQPKRQSRSRRGTAGSKSSSGAKTGSAKPATEATRANGAKAGGASKPPAGKRPAPGGKGRPKGARS